MKNILAILGVCIALNASAQLEIGSVAPEVHVDHIFNKADNITPSLESLKGKYVVLDFWATWCSPCVASFPKMDKLYTEFKDDNVQFLAISTEKLIKVENFVDHTDFNFWIGVNENKEDFKNYKITAIPQVYVINPEGKIVHQTHHLSKEDLEQIVATGSVNKQGDTKEKTNTNKEKNPLPYRGMRAGEDPMIRTAYFLEHGNNKNMPKVYEQQVLRPSFVKRYYGYKTDFSGDTTKITFLGAKLSQIIPVLFDLPSEVYINDVAGDTNLYDIVYYSTSANKKKAINELIESFDKNLGVQVNWEKYSVVQNSMLITNIPTNAIHNDSLAEGTYYLYTPFKVFVKHLENKSGEVYTLDEKLLDMTLLNDGIDRGKLYVMSVSEIENYLIKHGINFEKGNTKIKRLLISKI